jgi:hypothetical protein
MRLRFLSLFYGKLQIGEKFSALSTIYLMGGRPREPDESARIVLHAALQWRVL